MDNLTHTLTGLALARAGLDRACPRAAWLIVLAANIPDLDIATRLAGSVAYLNYHRHLTHSLAALPLVALLPVLVLRLFARQLPWRNAYLLSLAGAASHLALDGLNHYGVRYLLPFSGRWFRLDSTYVVDAWLLTALLLSVAAPLLSGLVGAEIGARKSPSRLPAILALCFLVVYNGGRKLLHDQAVAVLDARIYAGEAPRRVAAFPSPLNPWRWRGVVEGAGLFMVYDLNLRKEFDPGAGQIFYQPDPTPAIETARRSEAFGALLRFADFPLWTVLPAAEQEGAWRVSALDLRFATPQQPGFAATAIVDSGLAIRRAWFEFGSPRPR